MGIEQAVKADICEQFPDLRADVRLLPYIQLHEFEALLFSHPAAFADAINQPRLATEFQKIRDRYVTPEEINDSFDTAPSKRVVRICPVYRKVLSGTLAAQAVGIERMRSECPHFRGWIDQLQVLGS